MTLTPKEMRIVQKVSHPSWPKLTLWCILVIVACGVISLGIAIRDCVKLYHMVDAGIQPATISVMSETWVSLLTGGIALMSAIFIWNTRSYGLLIRKLGTKHDG